MMAAIWCGGFGLRIDGFQFMRVDIKQWFAVGGAPDTLALLLLSFFFFLPITISVAQPFAYLAVPFWLWKARSTGEERVASPFLWPILFFVVVLLLAALFGPRPEYSIPRSRRLLLLVIVFMMSAVFTVRPTDMRHSILMPMLMFVLGTTILGLWDLVRVPWEVFRGVALFDTGNMRDPQLYLVSVCFIMAYWIYRPRPLPMWLVSVTLFINVTGIVIHFKRGVWISFALTLFLMATFTRRYRIMVFILAGVAALFFIPQTRDRIDSLRDEWQEDTGGRRALWTSVAPELFRAYPMGTGFRALESEDFLLYSDRGTYIQPGLNHLHNNLMQVRVDAGWPGTIVWLYWMGLTLFLMIRLGRKYQHDDPVQAMVALACLAAFVGLMLNGLVEYNFGNSAIFMVLLVLMGLANTLYCYERRGEG
jgi:hypothetical protein